MIIVNLVVNTTIIIILIVHCVKNMLSFSLVKQFLFLQIRPEYEAAKNEYQAILDGTGLDQENIVIERICHVPMPEINFDNYSGIILGGGPATISDDIEKQSDIQKAFEPDLFELIKKITRQDVPFLGICYGPGVVAHANGGKVSKKYGEPVAAYNIELTQQGVNDTLFKGLPASFKAFAGHKESVEVLPKGATVLATSELCPVQGYRMGKNVYSFQFHPELDPTGLEVRINAYKHLGYFKPEDAEDLIASTKKETVDIPKKILKAFVAKYSH